MSRPIPMIDDLELDAVTAVRQVSRQRVLSLGVAGLQGDVQQRLGRRSHEIELRGVLVGDGVAEALEKLQQKQIGGEEATFTADITTALALEKVVIVEAEVTEYAGLTNRYEYRLVLRESPPLPEPASLEPFGGLDGFDLPFDTDVLGDIAGLAGDLQGAIEAAGDALASLEALASLADLGLGNPLTPIQEKAAELGSLGETAGQAGAALRTLLGG